MTAQVPPFEPPPEDWRWVNVEGRFLLQCKQCDAIEGHKHTDKCLSWYRAQTKLKSQ